MIENARLAAAYEDLEKAIVDYGEAQRAYAKDLRRGIHSGLSSTDFDKATRRYEAREKAFNREVSDAIKATGEVPPGAVNMLNYQRYNGFHAKGLAKIINQQEKSMEYVYMNKEEADALCEPRGVDSMVLLALTDGKEAWYGIEIDKKKLKIVLEDETEDSVYLKIVKKEKECES